MKKILIGIASVLLIVFAGAYIYISTIDWNQHKDKIAEQFSIVTGKRVVFEGPVSFQLLPSPYLSASNIKVYSNRGSYQTEPLAKIEQLVASLELIPLIFGGNFRVERMSLVNPEAIFEVMDDGTVNWQNERNLDAEFQVSEIEVSLNSVTIERAKVNFVYNKRGIDFQLENLNAEVIAQSIFGPYRIEGSYIRDNNPEGFAVSLGQFSESFATSVAVVLIQPAFETSFKFDGTVMFRNDAVNGNLNFESNKFADFVNGNFRQHRIPPECDKPLALSMEINTSTTQVDINNLVIKYGNTVGAGNVIIPLSDRAAYSNDEERPEGRKKVEFAFNMTEFDLNPVANILKRTAEALSKDKAVFSTDMGFDLIADIHAVKAEYNNQESRDLNLSVDVLSDEVKIHEFSATFPGETQWKAKGNVFPVNDVFTYNIENSFTSQNVARFLEWLGHKLPNEGEFAYKKASSHFGAGGNLANIKLSPFNLNIDKTVVDGEVGMVRGARPNLLLLLNMDSVNFDNYVKSLPQEEKQKDFVSKMAYRFSKLGFLNDFDARGSLSLGLGIYENIPFENSKLEFDLKDGALNIENMNIGNVANSAAELKGVLKGFGVEPKFENLRYSFEGNDIVSVINKFGINPPDINVRDLKTFSFKGIATGMLERAAVKVINKLGSIENVFSGEVARREGEWYLNGELELRAPDFVKFVNDMGHKYAPNVFTLGLFALKTKFVGSSNKFQATGLNVNVGANNFQGGVIFDSTSGRNNIVANLAINRFEIDRFFYTPNVAREGSKVSFKPSSAERAEFLSRPYLSRDKINYSFYTKFDLKGKMSVSRLSYKDYVFSDAAFDLSLLNSEAKVSEFKGGYENGALSGDFGLMMAAAPVMNGKMKIEKQNIREASWSGTRYGLLSGFLNMDADFRTSANSFEEMLSGLDAKVNFNIENPVVKGWNITMIYEDLAKRDKSEGLVAVVYDALQKGDTEFDEFSGNLTITNANFVLADSKLLKPNTIIEATASGSLTNWDMNSGFNLRFADLSKLPDLVYSFVGPMTSPKLSVDASLIAAMYDEHWAKVEADKKAQELSRLEALNNLMEQEQRKAFDLRTKIQKEIRPNFDAKFKLAENKDTIETYKLIESELSSVDAGIEEVFAQALVKDFDDSFIQELSKKNASLFRDVEELVSRMNTAYLQDIKFRTNDDYSKIVGIHNISKTKVAEYRDRLSEYVQRLAAIRTGYDIDKDENVKAFKDQIEQTLLDIDVVNSQIRKDYVVIQNSSDLHELEKYSVDVRGLLSRVDGDISLLDAHIAGVYSYLDGIVSREEKVYQDRKKEEEIQKKLEENTGKISVTGKGKDITVVRDIEEIQKSEDAASKEEVRVLDFSKGSDDAATSIKRKTETTIKRIGEESENVKNLEEQSGFVREITGEAVEAGGVIKKQ